MLQDSRLVVVFGRHLEWSKTLERIEISGSVSDSSDSSTLVELALVL